MAATTRLMMISAAAAMMSCPAVASAAPAAVFNEGLVSDTMLSGIVGKAGTTRFSIMVAEQARTFDQQIGENMRIGFDNWFADNNLQQLSNDIFFR